MQGCHRGKRRTLAALWSRTIMIGISSMVFPLIWGNPSVARLRLAPVTIELTVNRVTAVPTLDLPPLNQRPSLYAELTLDDQSTTTALIDTPQIGASVYPGWSIRVDKERVWVEPGHPIAAAIRIFDQDETDADDKVLLGALLFDPVTCAVSVGDTTVEGDRNNQRCTVTIPTLQGEYGSARVTLTATW